MRLFDVGHRLGVVIQPGIPKYRIPGTADDQMNHNENPDGEVIDSAAHKTNDR